MKAKTPGPTRCYLQLVSADELADIIGHPRECQLCMDRVRSLQYALSDPTYFKALKEAGEAVGVALYPVRSREYRSRERERVAIYETQPSGSSRSPIRYEDGPFKDPPTNFISWRCQIHRPDR